MMKKLKNNTALRQVIIEIIGAFAMYLVFIVLLNTGIINSYWRSVLLSVCINVILVVSLNVTTGFLGQLTLGHAGFMAVGAYSAAFFTKTMTLIPAVEFPLALLVGGLMAMLFGLLVCIPTLRLHGDYLAIITLAFGEIIKNILQNLEATGGAGGYIGIPTRTNFAWAFGLAAVTVIVTTSMIGSRQGRSIISIREDEIAAEASGVDTKKYKILAFVFAAFFAGLAGGLYGHYLGILEPKTFNLDKSIEILVMVVLGGMGSIPGSVIAAVILTVLPELLRSVSSLRMLVYSLALIFMMLFKYDPRMQGLAAKFRMKKEKKEA